MNKLMIRMAFIEEKSCAFKVLNGKAAHSVKVARR